MDRRRFVPSTEGLEVRTLQASNMNTLFGLQVTSNLNIPITYQQKELRIERLPYYLEQIRPGRFLPKAEIQQIQDSLYTMLDVIHRPPTEGLNNYNYQLRKVVSKQSLTATDINRLNQTFGGVLNSANASRGRRHGLKSALYQLTSQVDTASVLPVYLATNDYTLVLQTALAIGRPMPPPIAPKNHKNKGIQADTQHIKTPLAPPAVAGTYHFHTHIQSSRPQSQVVGDADVSSEQRLQGPDRHAALAGRPRVPAPGGRRCRPPQPLSRPFLIKVVPKRHH